MKIGRGVGSFGSFNMGFSPNIETSPYPWRLKRVRPQGWKMSDGSFGISVLFLCSVAPLLRDPTFCSGWDRVNRVCAQPYTAGSRSQLRETLLTGVCLWSSLRHRCLMKFGPGFWTWILDVVCARVHVHTLTYTFIKRNVYGWLSSGIYFAGSSQVLPYLYFWFWFWIL